MHYVCFCGPFFRWEANGIGLCSISNLKALTFLHIGRNEEATSLPEEMFKSLSNLNYLTLSSFCNLKELSTSLADLNTLEIEYCSAPESLPKEELEGLT